MNIYDGDFLPLYPYAMHGIVCISVQRNKSNIMQQAKCHSIFDYGYHRANAGGCQVTYPYISSRIQQSKREFRNLAMPQTELVYL